MQLDQVVLVDERDNQIGVFDKIEAHRGAGKRHRAISAFLFNAQGELLMQQRSVKKIVGALQWSNTCCGNVWPNESRLECAHRRLKVELGITEASVKPLYIFEYHVPANAEFSEWEVDEVFVGKYEGNVLPNPDEVKAYRWVSQKEIDTWIGRQDKTLAPWFEIMYRDVRLQKEWKTSYLK